MNNKLTKLLNNKLQTFNLEYHLIQRSNHLKNKEDWAQILFKLVSETLQSNLQFSKIREEEDQAQKSLRVKLVETWKLSIKLSIEITLRKSKHNTEFWIILKESWKNTMEVQAKQVMIDSEQSMVAFPLTAPSILKTNTLTISFKEVSMKQTAWSLKKLQEQAEMNICHQGLQ